MASTDSVQQVRERVLQMAREIESISRSSRSADSYFPEFLDLLVRAVGAQAGAVWMLENGTQLKLVCELSLDATGILNDPGKAWLNQNLLTEVISTGQANCYAPDTSAADQLPCENALVLAALQVGSDCVGVVEVFQRPDSPTEARAGYLQFVEQMTGYASGYLDQSAQQDPADSEGQFWQNLEQLLLKLQLSLDVTEIAATIANDCRVLLGCDRVSVAYTRGRKTVIKSISGQDAVNHRANQVQSMRMLVEKVIASGDPVLYAGRIDDLPPQIEEPLADYVHAGGSRLVALYPLYEPDPLVERGESSTKKRKALVRRKPVGCLIVEQVAESRPRPRLIERCELLSDHVAASLTNARKYERIVFMPVWRAMGHALEWFHGRKLAKTSAVLGGITALICALVFVPFDYKVTGEGKLMPVTQHEVFAPRDGKVLEIFVEGGDEVQAGEPLLKLEDDQLRAELLKTESEIELETGSLKPLGVQISTANRQGDHQKAYELQGKKQATETRIGALKNHLTNLKKRDKELIVRAPITGVVPTFQIEQLLSNRPVRRGEKLLEVMDDRGEWRVELQVEERRIGHVLLAQQQLETKNLPVEFRLATATENTYSGELSSMSTRAESEAEMGAVVQIFVSTNADLLPKRKIGAEVRAKINCGKSSVGYVLFGDVVEFIRQRLWW